jgi:hypothetical protein
MEATLITTENKKKKIEIKTFEEARQIVCNFDYNSPIQVITLTDGSALLLDEEGKYKNLPFNELATEIAKNGYGLYPSDFIVGDVLVLDMDEFDNLPYE